MSRLGEFPVDIPEDVDINIEGDNTVTVSGPRGELTHAFDERLEINIKEGQVVIERYAENKEARSQHGLARSLIDSMVEGVVDGFEKKLEMIGVGYGAQVKGKNLELEVGFSHPVTIEAPEDVEYEVEKGSGDVQSVITVRGIDKQIVGEVAARIREVRKPEPYKGKGIRYAGEQVRRKVGKTG
ncbi:MAG: 50S ribosomal protein L6 [Halanaerobiaceae bacterium]